jgi:hypothetical protein
MANVTPTIPVLAFPSSSFIVPANFTNRGTGNAGTNSAGVCTVRLGACGSAATGCCARTPGTPKHNASSNINPRHLAVRFMASPFSSATEEIPDFLSGQAAACFCRMGNNQGKLGDDPENCANTTPAFVQSQIKMS